MSVLEVRGLGFAVQGRQLLREISFSLEANELLVILGRNGAGKSTLFKHLTGEYGLQQGEIDLFNKSLTQYKTKDLALVRAVLPQSTHLNFDYKVIEVVLLGRIPHNRYQSESERDFEIGLECLQRVGLAGYANRDYLTLSGGEQQRVHFARVLAQLRGKENKRRILFLDEPTSSLDIAHQHQVLKIVKSLKLENVSTLAIVHDLNLAAQYADRILVLSEGKVLAIGHPSEVLTSSLVQEAFHHRVQILKHPHRDIPLIISDELE